MLNSISRPVFVNQNQMPANQNRKLETRTIPTFASASQRNNVSFGFIDEIIIIGKGGSAIYKGLNIYKKAKIQDNIYDIVSQPNKHSSEEIINSLKALINMPDSEGLSVALLSKCEMFWIWQEARKPQCFNKPSDEISAYRQVKKEFMNKMLEYGRFDEDFIESFTRLDDKHYGHAKQEFIRSLLYSQSIRDKHYWSRLDNNIYELVSNLDHSYYKDFREEIAYDLKKITGYDYTEKYDKVDKSAPLGDYMRKKEEKRSKITFSDNDNPFDPPSDDPGDHDFYMT